MDTRTIKFRGISKDTGRWIYGGFTQTPEAAFIVDYSVIVQKPKDGYPTVYDVVEVIPETVGQSTDLKDKNGKEIYHHDILQIRSLDLATGHFLGEVIWDYMAWLIRDGGMLDSFKNLHLEIIGNVHENPELLNK